MPVPPIALACSVVTLGALGALLAGERLTHETVRRVSKPLASAGFVGTALAIGALETVFGRFILAALLLSMLGDVLLLGRQRGPFLAGLLAFLAGHVAYVAAFLAHGVDVGWTGAAAAVLSLVAVGVGRWLFKYVEPSMRGPVLAYIVVICAMVALSFGAVGTSAGPWLIVGAVLFWISDLAVARDRFVAPGFDNRAWGLPLYYGAQLVFAWGLL